MDVEWSLTDGRITIRSSRPDDAAILLAGRDDESLRWFGPRPDELLPTACITLSGQVVGWVSYDAHREWLKPGEVNIGYGVFATHRKRGYASSAVLLLLQRLAEEGTYQTGTLSIHPGNTASLAVAAKAGFTLVNELPNGLLFARPVR